MKSYVVDANVIFSGIISGQDIYLKAFSKHTFYSPDFVLDEIQEYQSLLLQKTRLTHENLRTFTLQLFSKLTIVPNFLISTKSFLYAFNLCKDIDEKDTPYLALALEFDIELVSKDEELVSGLRRKGFQKVLSLKEFLESMEAI